MADNKDFLLFTVEHNLKSMSRYCEHDEDYVMTFEKKGGSKVEYHSTRAKVAEKYGDEPKDASVGHFDKMAMAWYDENHGGCK